MRGQILLLLVSTVNFINFSLTQTTARLDPISSALYISYKIQN